MLSLILLTALTISANVDALCEKIPTLPNREDNSPANIFKILKIGENQINYGRDRDVVVFMGLTGSGKTTFTLFIGGHDDDLLSEIKDYEYVITDKCSRTSTEETQFSSLTLFPQRMIDSVSNTTYFDMPGFDDTRQDIVFDIASSYLSKRVLDFAERVKLVFLVNKSNVQKNRDRNIFIGLVNHITTLIRDVSKFENSIALVATKVQEEKPPHTDDIEVQLILKFLSGARDILQKNEDEMGVKLIDIFSKHGFTAGKFNRIGIFRTPNDTGLLSDSPLMRELKRKLKNMIDKDLQFGEKSRDDFTYTLSQRSKIKIFELEKEVFKNTSAMINALSSKIKADFAKRESLFSDDLNEAEALFKAAVIDVTEFKEIGDFINFLQKYKKKFNVTIADEDLNTIQQNQESLDRLLEMSGKSPADWSQVIQDGMKDVSEYLQNQKSWYEFVSVAFDELSMYEIQSSKINYDLKSLRIQFKSFFGDTNVNEVELIELDTMKDFLNNVNNKGLLTMYNSLRKEMRITKSQLLLFEKVVNTTLDHVEDFISCSSKTFTIKAHYILLTKVEIEFRKCRERPEFVEIFALEKIFIDSSLDWTGKYVRTLSMIAPTWDTMGRPAEIILNGVNAENYKDDAEKGVLSSKRGKDGRAGRAGGSAGHFLGIAKNIIAGESLTVSANGGNGGNGQNGGEGARGIEEENAQPVKEDQCTFENVRKGEFTWDGHEQFVLCSYFEGLLNWKQTIVYMVLPRGSENVNGSDGGDGGRGGQGGHPGKVALIDLDLFPNSRTKIISKEGVDGRNGTGGNGGDNGYHYQESNNLYQIIEYQYRVAGSSYGSCRTSIHTLPGFPDKCRKEAKKHLPNGTRYHSGKAGDTGMGTEGWETPEIIPSNTLYNAINNYKIYARENIADNLHKMMLLEFLHKIDQNSAVNELYDTSGFVNELLGIENHSYKLRDAINMRPFYQSILTRTLKYAQTLNTTNEKYQQYKKVLAFIYTTVLSKIVNYKYAEIMKGKIVIGIQEYLTNLNAELLEFKALRTKEVVDKLKKEYANEIDQKVNEGKILITSTISPQTEAIFSHIDKTLYSLIDTINTKMNQTKAEAEEAKKKLKEFERLMRLRGTFGALKIVSALFSLIPYGAVVSAALQGSIALTEAFVFNNEPGISSEQLTALKKDTEKITKALREVYKEKLEVAKTQLKDVYDIIEKFQKGESDYPEIEWPKEKAKNIRKEIDKILKRDEGLYSPSELENIRSEHDKLYKILKDHEKEAKTKKRKQFLKNIIDIVSLVDVPLEVYAQFAKDKKKRSAMAEVVKVLWEKLKALEAYKHEVYATIFPTFENLNNNIKQTINSIDGKSRFGLNVAQWRVQITIKKVQHQMTKMMKDYPQELEINFDMESLLDGMTKIIQMYDQIEAYREHVKFASYIANLHSANADDVPVEPELQSDIHRLETTIKANQIMFEYNSGIQIVKQVVFPFADFFMGHLALPISLKFSDNDSLITDLVGQIAVNIENINKRMDHWNRYIHNFFDDYINNPIWFGGVDGLSPPLMIWNYEDYGEKIRKLLNGEAVSFPSNIEKGINGNAVKFKTILFTLNSENTTSVVQLYEKLKYFRWEMVHTGNSYYRCNNKYYVAYNEKLVLKCAFQQFSKELPEKRNLVYNKIKDNYYILSPYATWKLRLIPDGLHVNSSLSNINSTEHFDLVMNGEGQYIDIDPGFSACDDENLSEFYEEIKWKTSDVNTPAMDQIKLVSKVHDWFNAKSQQ